MNFRQFILNYYWWGKALGGFFGYLIGGASGALIGILIGNFFDRSLIKFFNRPHWSFYAEKRQTVQKIFFEATFSVMGYVAKADGRVSEKEIAMANALMKEMHLNREQKELAKQFFRQGKEIHFNLSSILNQLKNVGHDNLELIKLFMDIQYQAAQADGLSAKKIQALNIIFRQMGFAPLQQQYRFYEDFGYDFGFRTSSQHSNNKQYSHSTHQQSPSQSSHHPLDYAYAILEISKNATKQEVKRAYRQLISRNHPDKLIAKGLPEEMIKLANDKTQKIRKAYEEICANKGW